MIWINGWNDLKPLGIEYLTGESCAYGQRMLCGLNEKGADVVCDFYGITRAGLRDPWNSTAWGEKAVGSFLLPANFGEMATLILCGLCMVGCTHALQLRWERLCGPSVRSIVLDADGTYRSSGSSNRFVGIEPEDTPGDRERMLTLVRVVDTDDTELYKVYDRAARVLVNSGRRRNEHQMSGRVE